MKYRIIADSSCDLPMDFLANDDIDFSIVPLTINIDGKEFVDDDTLDVKALVNAMRTGKHTSSACPSPEEFGAEFRKNLQSFCVTMTSYLSGTYNSAVLGAEFAKEENPDAQNFVIDSLSTSSAMILLVMKLRDMIKEGLDFTAICEKIQAYEKTLSLRFVLFDLGNLVKAGRMSKVAGVFASALSLCPIMGDNGGPNGKGEIRVLEKVRGAKLAISHLANTVEEKLKVSEEFPVVITHCDNAEQANDLKNLLIERFGLKDIHIFPMRGLASYYSNNKGIIMAF